VKKAAHNAPRDHGKPRKLATVADVTRTTFGKLKKSALESSDPAVAAPVVKSQFKKLAGTRLQQGKGGTMVRVVIEDGKCFDPENLFAAKGHMVKLGKQREEAAEISRLRGEEPAVAPVASQGAPTVPMSMLRKKTKAKARKTKAVANKMTKKERKKVDRSQRLQAHEELRAKRLSEDDRKPVSEDRFHGKVVERAKGFAWVQLAPDAVLPDRVREKIREMHAQRPFGTACAVDGDTSNIVPAWFFDVEEAGLNLQVGVEVSMQLYCDKRSVGGCRLSSASAPPPAPAATRSEAEAPAPEAVG